jgi:hypothetical protein
MQLRLQGSYVCHCRQLPPPTAEVIPGWSTAGALQVQDRQVSQYGTDLAKLILADALQDRRGCRERHQGWAALAEPLIAIPRQADYAQQAHKLGELILTHSSNG